MRHNSSRQIRISYTKPKKMFLMLPSPDQNLKLWSVVWFFFFLRKMRELSFPIFFQRDFPTWGNSGGMQSRESICSKSIASAFYSVEEQILQILQRAKADIRRTRYRADRSEPRYQYTLVGRAQPNTFFFFGLMYVNASVLLYFASLMVSSTTHYSIIRHRKGHCIRYLWMSTHSHDTKRA